MPVVVQWRSCLSAFSYPISLPRSEQYFFKLIYFFTSCAILADSSFFPITKPGTICSESPLRCLECVISIFFKAQTHYTLTPSPSCFPRFINLIFVTKSLEFTSLCQSRKKFSGEVLKLVSFVCRRRLTRTDFLA